MALRGGCGLQGWEEQQDHEVEYSMSADNDAETAGEKEDAEEGAAAGVVEVKAKGAGIAFGDRDVVICRECDGTGDDGNSAGEIGLDLEEIRGDEVNQWDHDEAEKELFIDTCADGECGLGLPGKIRD